MAITRITNHVMRALALFMRQFKGKPKIEALVTALVQPLQDIEDIIIDMISKRSIDGASDAQLDGLGSIIGEDRDGRNDVAYKIAIRARIRINVSSGTPEDVLVIFAALGQGNLLPNVTEYYPASALVTFLGIIGITDAEAAAYAAVLREIRPLGINTQMLYSNTDADHTFSFASADAEESSTVQGWSEDDHTNGGELADSLGA